MFLRAFMLGCVTVEVSLASSIWGINVDTPQLDPRPATNFELFFPGNITAEITGGGTTDVTNGFAGPARSASFDGATNTTTVTFSSSVGGSIGMDTLPWHFGIFGDGVQPGNYGMAWSYPPEEGDPLFDMLGQVDWSSLFFPNNTEIQITNPTSSFIDVSQLGYILSPALIPLESLNRNLMPPSSFIPLPALDGTYAPGESRVFFVPNPSQEFVIGFETATFHGGPPSGNPQSGSTRTWTEAGNVPEPAPGFLLCAGLAALYLGRCRAVSRLKERLRR